MGGAVGSSMTLRTAKRVRFGRISLIIWTCFVAISGPPWVSPVRFPPGAPRLATKPTATGSLTLAKTIGIDIVAALAASDAGVPDVAMMSGLLATAMAAYAGKSV